MIKMTCNEHDVIEMARKCDRMGKFGYDGWLALYQYLEGLSEDIGEDIELDLVGWCCDYQRFESLGDYVSQYGPVYDDVDDIEELVCFIEGTTAFICYAH